MENPKKLGAAAAILGGFSIIILVFVAIIGEYSITLRDSTTATADDQASALVASLSAPNTSNRVGSVGTYPYITALTGCELNGSIPLAVSNYTVSRGDANGGYITLVQAASKYEDYELTNCSTLTYLEDTAAQSSADAFSTGLGTFGTLMALLSLALVGKFILGLFRKD